MGVIGRSEDDGAGRPALTREARAPLPSGRRPCWLVGLGLAVVLGVGLVQGMIGEWNQARARQQALHERAVAAEETAAELERQVRELRARLDPPSRSIGEILLLGLECPRPAASSPSARLAQ